MRPVVLAACLSFLICPLIGHAADEGQITISVTDSATKAAVVRARVLLEGPLLTSEFTGVDGTSVFRDAPSGIYTVRVGKAGYSTVTSAQFEVLEGRSILVDVSLTKSAAVKTLGTVMVKSTSTNSATSVSDTSSNRKLSDSLTDALGSLSGVSISTDPSSSDATETVSLEGHSAAQTALTLDSIPLNAPGAIADLRHINTDLFAGASVRFNPTAGALGGGVNFRTLDATLTWQGRFSTTVGSYSKASTVFSEQGSLGGLGLVFVHAIRGGDNPLDGVKYLDTSGLDYIHAGAEQAEGDLVKLRARLGSAQTLTGLYMSSNNYRDILCTDFSGPLPCGFGPGNSNYRHFAFGSLTDNALIGLTILQLAIFGTDSSVNHDLLNRFVGGVAYPFGDERRQRTRGAVLNAQLPSHERHTFSIQLAATNSTENLVPFSASTPPFTMNQGSKSYWLASLTDTIKANLKLTLGERIGVASFARGSTSLIGGVNAQWTPAADDSYSGSFDIGQSDRGPLRVGVLTDAAALRFNCSAGVGFGNGPGDASGPASSSSARVSWQHRIGSGQITTMLYRQIQNDTLVDTLVNGSALPPTYFPPGYFSTAQQIFQTQGGCGAVGASFGPANVYINQPIGGVRRLYQGLQISGGFPLGRDLLVQPYYDAQQVTTLSHDPRLDNPLSVVLTDVQVPSVPMHRAGVTLDYHAPNSVVEWLARAQDVSVNNAQNLPAYATVDAGVSINFDHGTLVVAGTNLFAAHAGDFATPQNAVPLATVGGAELPTLAQPLAPHQVTVTYAVKFGANAYVASISGAREANALDTTATKRFLALLAPLPTVPPAHPFEVDATRPSCRPDAARAAVLALDGLKAYVAAVEATKTPAGYPDSAPVSAPAVPGFAVAYHRTDTSYALELTRLDLKSLRSFAACAPVSAGTVEQAQALHLYVPESTALYQHPLAYSPAVGLYIVRRPAQTGQEQFRLYKLPSKPPAQPFAVQPSSRCASDQQPMAEKLLSPLAQFVTAYETSKATSPQPAGWTVTPHTTATSYWLELRLTDFSNLAAVLTCGHVSTGSAAEVRAAGYDGAQPPSLNYAPSLGLYLVRPQRHAP